MAINKNNPYSVFPYFMPVLAQKNGSDLDTQLIVGQLGGPQPYVSRTDPTSTTDAVIGDALLASLQSLLSADQQTQLTRSIAIWKRIIDTLAAPTETPITVNDSTTIDFTTSGTANHTLTGAVIISPDANNLLSNPGNGLFSTQTSLSVTDTNSIDLTASGTANHNLQADVKISTTTGNQLSVDGTGLVVTGTLETIQASAAIAQGDALRITGTAAGLLTMAPTNAQSQAVHAIAHQAISNGAQGAVTIKGVVNVKASGTTVLGNPLGSTSTSGTLAALVETTLVVVLNIVTTPPTGAQAFAQASGRAIIAMGPIAGGQCSAYIC